MGMTEQEKRDWVIEGLEFTLEESGWDANEAYDQELMIQVVKDAIALLRAQKPRVMTATEAYTADCVYIEFDGVITPAIRTNHERDGHCESYFAAQQLGGDWMRWDDYGIAWRCWTSRPTDVQREATPWG